MENVLMTHPAPLLNLCKARDYLYYDENGKEYIDLESGIWCASLGHSHPEIVKVIEKQARTFIHAETRLKPRLANNIASKILNKAEMKGKAFFMNTGSEAIDFAITLARLDNEKREIVGFSENYLGAYGQITEMKSKIDIKKCNACTKITCKSCPELTNKISKNFIFIFDSFCFKRQVLEIPKKLIEFLKLELKKKKGILIMDEITTGLGRTGKWFGFQHYGLKPDLIVLGKTLGNGYPISAVLMTNKIAGFAEKKGFSYGQSHQNDPMGCKIAESVIDTLENEGLIKQAEIKGRLFLEHLKAELGDMEEIMEVRGKGMMIAIEINKKIDVENIYQRLIKKGLIVGLSAKYNIINFFPAFTLPEKLFHQITLNIKDAILNESKLQSEITKKNLSIYPTNISH